MAKKRKKAKKKKTSKKTKRSKPKLKFKPKPVAYEKSTCVPEVKLAIWGIIAIVVIIILVMYFTGLL